jgi:hypothetical protein
MRLPFCSTKHNAAVVEGCWHRRISFGGMAHKQRAGITIVLDDRAKSRRAPRAAACFSSRRPGQNISLNRSRIHGIRDASSPERFVAVEPA